MRQTMFHFSSVVQLLSSRFNMTKTSMMLLFFCHVGSPAKYNTHLDQTLSFGYPNIPNFMEAGTFQDITAFFYNDSMTTAKVTHDLMRVIIKNNEKEWEISIQDSINSQHAFKAETDNFNQQSDQTAGGFIVQQRYGCEWDEETDKAEAYIQFGNNGEDFIAFDMKTETWIASTERAETIKLVWDQNKVRNEFRKNSILTDCPRLIKIALSLGKLYIDRKDLPSVSLLQKTPSSPVSCHATGFYPDRAVMFWSKDGEEIHEGVNHGNILPNHDESYQLSVDLEVSSIPPEDWTKYDCVFQFAGVQNVTMIKLDKNAIMTNYKKSGILDSEGNLSEISIAVIVVVAVLIVIIVTTFGFMTVKKRNERPATPSSDTISL